MKTLSFDQMKTLRILLVDDDSFALRIVRHILYGLGVGFIEEAFDGESAQETLAKQNFDLVITDVEMPKLNGLGLLKAIRCGTTQAPRDLPTIIITALTNSEVLRASLALDVNGFLAKPMKPVDVCKKISSALDEITSTRPISDYEPIETDLKALRQKSRLPKKSARASMPLDQAEKVEEKASKPTAPPIEGKQVFIRELKPGMQICQDLYLKDTSLLLKSGYTLTATTISRLVDLRSMLQDGFVLVMPEKTNKETQPE